MEKFNKLFDKIYEENSNKGYKIIKKKFNELGNKPLKEKIIDLINFIQSEVNALYKHE